MQFLEFIAAVTVGYVGSIYSWPAVRTSFRGALAEASALRLRAIDLENKIKKGTW